MSKEELISSLAMAAGFANPGETKYSPSRYDEATRTLYCNGCIITGNILDEAKAYFTATKNRLEKENTPESKHMALIYMAAIEAISMMQDKK